MDTILVVNAGSSSVKFQVFGADREGAADRLIKGQMDGIGTRPRLRAEAADSQRLVDRIYAQHEVKDVPAAIAVLAGVKFFGSWGDLLNRWHIFRRNITAGDQQTVGFLSGETQHFWA